MLADLFYFAIDLAINERMMPVQPMMPCSAMTAGKLRLRIEVNKVSVRPGMPTPAPIPI